MPEIVLDKKPTRLRSVLARRWSLRISPECQLGRPRLRQRKEIALSCAQSDTFFAPERGRRSKQLFRLESA
jgi:hypothetical protein